MYSIKVNENKIDDVLNGCVEADERGVSKFPGMTYEQGVQNAILWITGAQSAHPLED
jgi:hypothetical protein